MQPVNRRTFFSGAAALAATIAGTRAVNAAATATSSTSHFIDLHRQPDLATVYVYENSTPFSLDRQGTRWQAHGVEIRIEVEAAGVSMFALAPSLPMTRIHVRWTTNLPSDLLFMADAWERSYGDLAWRSMVPDRVMPWYFATHDAASGVTHGYGVKTGPGAFCFWQVDPGGVSLWLDTSNGGMGVVLGQRELYAATVVTRQGQPEEHPADAVKALCIKMCPNPRLPSAPVYGTNDWYYAYGNNTQDGILRDTELVASLAPKTGARPFSVIDMGWEGNTTFPDMAKLAREIRAHGARPGIWIRPTLAPAGTKPELLLPMKHFHSPGSDLVYDPTIPEALQLAIAKLTQVVGWKYDLVKHDFSTFDLMGQWGFEMGATPAISGWSFHDRSRTNAEIVLGYYNALRVAACESTLLLGCNTVSHLAAGVFEMQRTGDDTSGKLWERTRRMGINTLAYRMPQDGSFYSLDADCVGITKAIPWELNRQWMDLLARSGTGLFISPSPDAIGDEQRAAIKHAFAIAASGESRGRATNWFGDTTPQGWEFRTGTGGAYETRRYDWYSGDGAYPYPV